MEKKYYSVWVGDGEITDNYIEKIETAKEIADSWRDKGFDGETFIEVLTRNEYGEFVHESWLDY